jgi:flagellar hook-associated protein 3 FlgL
MLDSVCEQVDTTASSSALSAVLSGANDPTASGKQALGSELIQLADSIVQTMNTKYVDNFIFSGADGTTVPFTWEGDDDLLYRGINVSVSEIEDPAEYAKLEAMANETNYVDIGLGMQINDADKVIGSSAFNDALQGINYLGYGKDEDGDSQNIACIIKRMGTLLSKCDATTGEWENSDAEAEYERLMGKLETASANLKSAYVQLDTKASFLENNSTQLETKADTLNEQFLDIEQCDLADAITAFSWAQYCYNAALKVGNDILSQSLIDYMN